VQSGGWRAERLAKAAWRRETPSNFPVGNLRDGFAWDTTLSLLVYSFPICFWGLTEMVLNKFLFLASLIIKLMLLQD
jgi:hypothetical protein